MSLIYGHRGASGYAPENTLEAFKLAMDMGPDGALVVGPSTMKKRCRSV